MNNIRYIEEPLLQFGTDQHICPKAGIFSSSPYDINQVRPEKIAIGIIGKSESIDQILEWINGCRTHIEGKQSKKPLPNLFLNFCGFNPQVGFKSEIVYDDGYIRKINNSEFDKIIKNTTDLEKRIVEIAGLYLAEIKYLSKNKKPDVILCALSEKFITFIQEDQSIKEDDDEASTQTEKDFDDTIISDKEQNFRRYLKAHAMKYNVPLQLVRDRIVNPTSEMQDPATIAWNFFTALYYKASGTPWALIRRDNSETTCFAGISFFKSRDRKSTQTSIAQIFNELGKGVILRGEEIKVSKNDLVPHMDEKQSYDLISMSLREYYEAVKIYPKRLVIHKTSNFNQDEIYGFTQAAKDANVYQMDLTTIQPARFRLYRNGKYPPLRGTLLQLSDDKHLLYTRGSVPYFETYTGKYIPSPIEVRIYNHDESPDLICDEIFALTKMNWNNTQFDRKFPITIECARNVGEILKYLNPSEPMQLKYSFYM